MQKLVNNAYNVISALVFLAIPVVFQLDLKVISCRIEWPLFQVDSPKHVRVKILILACYHKPTIVAHPPYRVNLLKQYFTQTYRNR